VDERTRFLSTSGKIPRAVSIKYDHSSPLGMTSFSFFIFLYFPASRANAQTFCHLERNAVEPKDLSMIDPGTTGKDSSRSLHQVRSFIAARNDAFFSFFFFHYFRLLFQKKITAKSQVR